MPTTIPPAANEWLDGDAVMWAYNNGYLAYYHCPPVPDVSGRAFNTADDFIGVWEGPSTMWNSRAGRNYAPTEIPTWDDVQAWADAGITLPCTTAPNINATGSDSTALQARITVSWTNPANANSNWYLKLWRSTDSTISKNWTEVANVQVNGANLSQNWSEEVTPNVTHYYKALYYVPGRMATGPESSVTSAFAQTPQGQT